MFENFDFEVLNDPEFKEDAVREEIILPLIKQLGYTLTGNSKIIRSKSLVHPYVAIGSKQRKVSIVPDYVFYSDNKPYWILDAKSPIEEIIKSKHVEQAYSYAIHPEIRAELYALCNGKEFALFEIRKFEPILHFKLENIAEHWNALFRILNPEVKANPALLEYKPDYGVYIKKVGAVEDFKFIAMAVHSKFIAKVSDNQYTTMTVVPGDIDCMVSFYFDEERYQQLLSILPDHLGELLQHGLRQMPYYVSLDNSDEEFMFGVSSTISEQVIENNEESYIPFIVDEFMEHLYHKFPIEP
ncbi:type I restriction enzyme HsdR N-terminal domain-containing protein [Desulfobacter curvatus]|uniref:type I restriction enzyme HsdR N-terminal domain-containing protein n=1 Tax=Desulfobacter curvatus TaxID=2290 RepID=UPI0003808DD5|nr:type I restriction enzyme HsdR N-terminal domain-containing protein [Desulfobacter curvatus]